MKRKVLRISIIAVFLVAVALLVSYLASPNSAFAKASQLKQIDKQVGDRVPTELYDELAALEDRLAK